MRMAFTILVLTANLAAADTYSECQAAIAAGNHPKAEELAQTILKFRNVAAANQGAGAACLKFATGKEYSYDFISGSFSTPEEAQASPESNRKASADAAERRRLELKAESDAEQASADKIRSVWRKVIESCNELYDDNPNIAITNSVCFDLFLKTGLPDK